VGEDEVGLLALGVDGEDGWLELAGIDGYEVLCVIGLSVRTHLIMYSEKTDEIACTGTLSAFPSLSA
jgi:hypothetical protein